MRILNTTTALLVCLACGDSTVEADPAPDGGTTTAALADCTSQTATGAGVTSGAMSSQTGTGETGPETGNSQTGTGDSGSETGNSQTETGSGLDCTAFESCWGDRWKDAYGLDGYDTNPDCTAVYWQFCAIEDIPCDRVACGVDCDNEREAIEWDCANNWPECDERRSELLLKEVCQTEFKDLELLCDVECLDIDPIDCRRDANLALMQCLEGVSP